jgi:hypothetical protein
MADVIYTGFTVNSGVRPLQAEAIAAFEALAFDNPELTRVALGLGDPAVRAAADQDALSAARGTVNRLLATRADLELGVPNVSSYELERNDAYQCARLDWLAANWASKPNPERERARNRNWRLIRLRLLTQAALETAVEIDSIPEEQPLDLRAAA